MLALGLSMVAGLGVVLIIIALGVGAVEGASADSNAIGLMFAAGLILFLLGAISWYSVLQPQKYFDDINVPLEAEPHHGAHDSHDHAEEHTESEAAPVAHH